MKTSNSITITIKINSYGNARKKKMIMSPTRLVSHLCAVVDGGFQWKRKIALRNSPLNLAIAICFLHALTLERTENLSLCCCCCFSLLNHSFCQHVSWKYWKEKKKREKKYSFGSMVNSQIVNANSSFIYQSLYCRLLDIHKSKKLGVCMCVVNNLWPFQLYIHFNFMHFKLDKCLLFGHWGIELFGSFVTQNSSHNWNIYVRCPTTIAYT